MLTNTANPRAAAMLISVIRHRIPVLRQLWDIFLGYDIACEIPRHLIKPHPHGIVLHNHVVLGNNVVLMQQSTIGVGTSGLGGIHIRPHTKIGANAVVTKDVPPYAPADGYNHIILHNLSLAA